MGTMEEFLINMNKDENRKLKTDIQPVGKIYDLRRFNSELESLMFKTCNTIHNYQEEIKMISRMLDRFRPKTCECAENLKLNSNDLSSSTVKMRRVCVCGKYKSNRSVRFNPLLKAPKMPKQESEEEYKSMESLMNQNKNYLYYGKMNYRIYYPLLQTTSASSLRSSTVTENNSGMEPLLKKLNDISIQDMEKD